MSDRKHDATGSASTFYVMTSSPLLIDDGPLVFVDAPSQSSTDDQDDALYNARNKLIRTQVDLANSREAEKEARAAWGVILIMGFGLGWAMHAWIG